MDVILYVKSQSKKHIYYIELNINLVNNVLLIYLHQIFCTIIYSIKRLKTMMNFKAQENEGQKEAIDEIKKEFSEILKSVPELELTKEDKKNEKKKIEEEVTNLSNIFKNDPYLFEKTIHLFLYDENSDINTLKLLTRRLEIVKKSLGINENGTCNEKNFEKYKKNLNSKSIKELNISMIDFYNFINPKSTIITRKEIPKEETPTSRRSKDIEPYLPENREIKNNF